MAIACFGSLTFFPDRPLLSSPRFISCMARSTLRLASFCLVAMASRRLRFGLIVIERARMVKHDEGSRP